MERSRRKAALIWLMVAPICILVFAIFSGLIIHNSVHPSFKFDQIGLAYFIELYRIPLQALGGFIIVSSIAIAIYRSISNDQQLRIAEIGAFRSNFLEVRKTFESKFEVLNIDLQQNLNHIFPLLLEGNNELNPALELELRDIATTMKNCMREHPQDRQNLGHLTGLHLARILGNEFAIKDLLIFQPSSFQAYEVLELRFHLLKRAKDYLTLIEFISNFKLILSVREINSIRSELIHLGGMNGQMKQLRSGLKSAINNSHLDKAFEGFKTTSLAEKYFNHYLMREILKDSNRGVLKNIDYYQKLCDSIDSETSEFLEHTLDKIYTSQNFGGVKSGTGADRYKSLISIV